MLVLLVGVTIILLLIMGVVSSLVLKRGVAAQTAAGDRRLAAAATLLARDPTVAEDQNQDGYAAVEVPLRPLTVQPLTAGTLTTQLASAVRQWLQRPGIAPVMDLAQRARPRAAAALLAAEGCAVLPRAGCRPVRMAGGLDVVARRVQGSGGAALLFVGQAAASGPAQVSGFVVAELITGAALIALLALGGTWLIARGLDPLDRMTRTADEITTRGDLTARMPDAGDRTEVGRLGTAINTMLDRIQQAFTARLRSEQKVREFAADASHELRTPLTTIRGYAELYRQGALGPGELPGAMRRIEQEAERMSRLVAELLELARLDRTSSLDLAEADLAELVRDAVADTRAVEPGREVRAEAPARLVAVVDEARIRQVLANLLANVRLHTPADAAALVRLSAPAGGVLLEVADTGPGMDQQDAIRAFDRFHRAAAPDEAANDAAGNDTAPGSGLGLAIVQAIAAAHGGRATLDSSPAAGTRVRIWLPVRVAR
ncbi:MAG TPA: HAMP domain-containing sensor histidine kinase [Streptosporangiaceae bacterium]|jgi:two-component system OmpR family sensor kinase